MIAKRRRFFDTVSENRLGNVDHGLFYSIVIDCSITKKVGKVTLRKSEILIHNLILHLCSVIENSNSLRLG